MGVLDDSDDSSSSDSDASAKRRASNRPLNDQSGRMTPFARVKLEQQRHEEELCQDFCDFAQEWLEPIGCVQKSMVVLYFREHFDNRKYKHSTSAEDHEIEEAMEKWNGSEGGPKAEMNEFGLYLGVQINAEHDAKVKEQEALERRKTQVKLIIADSKRSGVKPPLDVLKEAMELGVIVVPKATLESMKQVGGRQRRATMSVARHPPQPPPDSPEKKSSRRKKSLKRMGKSMGDIDFTPKSDRKDRKKDKSPKRDKDKERKRDKASSSPSRRKSSSRMGKSMSDFESSSRRSKDKDKDRDRDKDKEKEKKSSRKDKDKDEKKSSSRMHKSMGALSYSPERDRKSSKSKDKEKEKKSSKDKDREKEKKSSSRDKDREKEKKSSSRKSSRRSSIA